ncbi:hypothetical protein MCC93_03910 [Morococcus cerebrosus]|uniref:Uncharacterized protein n=1 Tax=Morococcus cerebrosus TaxID=1056807 RepID=A0A0C1H4K3_9NEIS|nr:hypothetical protein MCC93_03910 [Morococcus cerebrosus]
MIFDTVFAGGRHSRAGGKPSKTLNNRCLKNGCRNSKVDSCLSGNDGMDAFDLVLH